jgi:lipid A ethanolaminephosphotransferase
MTTLPQMLPAALARRFSFAQGPWHIETLLLACCAWWVLACNLPFFAAALVDRPIEEAGTWLFALALATGLVALHALVLAPLVLVAPLTRPLLMLLAVVGGISAHFMSSLGLYMDPTMLRNVLHTETVEARELWSWSLLAGLALYAGPPALLVAGARLREAPLGWAVLRRGVFMLVMLATVLGLTLVLYGPLSGLMRNHKELRYLINPAAPLWSFTQALRAQRSEHALAPRPLGTDARLGERAAARAAGLDKPLLVVMVVGETARAANWGLSGYARQTTPELAALAASAGSTLINVPRVQACGTNTEASLPCMFAPVGRRDYDEARIRGSESLLHLVARAGVGVSWRDNQSGCKGVCSGLPQQHTLAMGEHSLCADGRCLDEALLHELPAMLRQARGTQLLVLHTLGSHGPSYFRRYPAAQARFQPECRHDELRRCSPEEIVNAYDNTLLYTDAVLARLTRMLAAEADRLNSAMLYVSDHGESLGENGLYLHGLPWSLAPLVQKQVPMVLWSSSGFAAASGLDWGCLRRRATQGPPPSHDHLFHSLLTLLDVRTALHEPGWDLTQGCLLPAAH